MSDYKYIYIKNSNFDNAYKKLDLGEWSEVVASFYPHKDDVNEFTKFIEIKAYEGLKVKLDDLRKDFLAIKDYTSFHQTRQKEWDAQYIHAVEEKIKDALQKIRGDK